MLALSSTLDDGKEPSRVRALKPLCIDLYCGLGGWAEGFLSEGYDVIGFDIERHDYGTGGYPGQLVLQDVTTLHGSQFKGRCCHRGESTVSGVFLHGPAVEAG